jgi:hypothetical protein
MGKMIRSHHPVIAATLNQTSNNPKCIAFDKGRLVTALFV